LAANSFFAFGKMKLPIDVRALAFNFFEDIAVYWSFMSLYMSADCRLTQAHPAIRPRKTSHFENNNENTKTSVEMFGP
jgi:hypothetical protein